MTRKNKPEVKQQIEHPKGYPVGTISEEFWDGSKEITYTDGTKEFIDAAGKSLVKLNITEMQIEAWKKMPKEEATKEILKLINDTGIDVSEKRFILDAIWKLAELHGATQPAPIQGMQMLAVHINIAQPPSKIKDIEAKVIQ